MFRQVNSAVALSGALASGDNASVALEAPGGSGGAILFGVHSTAVSGTSPTLDVVVEESNDQETWTAVDGAALTQVTAADQTRLGFCHLTMTYFRVVGT